MRVRKWRSARTPDKAVIAVGAGDAVQAAFGVVVGLVVRKRHCVCGRGAGIGREQGGKGEERGEQHIERKS